MQVMTSSPNDTGLRGALFGQAIRPEEADMVLLPVPWEVTVCSGTGAALGPQGICLASCQVDLFDPAYPRGVELKIAMPPAPEAWCRLQEELRPQAAAHIQALEQGQGAISSAVAAVNAGGYWLKEEIKAMAQSYLAQGKMVGLVGGDHSTPQGLVEALSQQEGAGGFGVLQIDAHADLRKAYQGFAYSHASIAYNLLALPLLGCLVQVGLRDYCHEEAERIAQARGRIVVFSEKTLQGDLFAGRTWEAIAKEIVATLPGRLYITLDIDGLDPALCPGTGTPVPGGLSFAQVLFLLDQIVEAGKVIIGFDLCEVAPGEGLSWDGRVGSQLLYKLALRMAASQGRLHPWPVQSAY